MRATVSVARNSGWHVVMHKRVFDDFDEFADSLRVVSGRFLPTGPSVSDWWIDRLQLGRITVQRMQIGGAATFAGAGACGVLTLGVPLSAPEEIRINGRALGSSSFVLLRDGQPFTSTSRKETRWGGITLPIDHAALAEQPPHPARPHEGPRTHTHLPQLDQLRALITRLSSGGAANVHLRDPNAARAAEQELSLAVVRALERSSRVTESRLGRPNFSRERVIARTLQLVEDCRDQALLVSDLCTASAVSERTLRNVFQEYFGVGPIRFLKLRQLREIHAALARADPAHETVTQLAGRFGIWDFSLFARNYKRLYGESPSETLRKPRATALVHTDASWFWYAAKIFSDDGASAQTRDADASLDRQAGDRQAVDLQADLQACTHEQQRPGDAHVDEPRRVHIT
jgi:AraC family transcriptional regulator, ethanolamine operon transcriptional activator